MIESHLENMTDVLDGNHNFFFFFFFDDDAYIMHHLDALDLCLGIKNGNE